MNYLPRKIAFDKDARSRIASGADKLARAVISTLGPRSNNVAIHTGGAPKILHDGVSVAREIRFRDPFEDLGCLLLRQAAIKTNDLAGDGTTTATLLANTILQNGLKLIDETDDTILVQKKGVNKMQLKDLLIKFSGIICDEIDKLTKKVETQEELEYIATISAADKMLGKLIAEAWEKIGVDGQVLIETGSVPEDKVEIQKGYKFDNGYLSPYFMTDPDRYITTYNKAYVLIADYVISTPAQLIPIVSEVFQTSGDDSRPLLIIANDVNGMAMSALVNTRLKQGREVCAVMAPEWAERRKEALEDIAILTGGVVANPQTLPIESVHLQHLGRANNIFVDQRETAINPENPDREEIDARIAVIKEQIAGEKTEWIADKMKERLARISQSLAVIKIHANSDVELADKRERTIDAVFSTKAALQDGYVPGGGAALYQISEKLSENENSANLPDGVLDLIIQTLQSPMRTLLQNSGFDAEAIIASNNESADKHPAGSVFDVVRGIWVEALAGGIIDPAKVTKLAVKHSFSVGATILTTSTAIVDDEVDQNAKSAV